MAQAPSFRAYDEVASFFARGPSPEEIATFRLSDRTIERVRALLAKHSAVPPTTEEQAELDDVGQRNRMLLLIRSRIPRPGTSASDIAPGTVAPSRDGEDIPDGARCVSA